MKAVLEERIRQVTGLDSATVEFTTDLAKGDLVTSVAMQAAKQLGKSPLDLANEIVAALGQIDGVTKVEVAAPGFINFWLDDTMLVNTLTKAVSQATNFGRNNNLAAERVMLEYTTQNVLKQFHLGHLMSNCIGLAIANLYEWSGATVKRDSYQGDVGMHIAKAVWGMQKISVRPESTDPIEERMKYLGQAYATGATAYEEDELAEAQIKDINSQIYERTPGPVWDDYLLARDWSLESFNGIYERLGVKLDFNFFESHTDALGVAESEKALALGILTKSDGAILYQPVENEKLVPVVFINSQGYPTYAAKDLGLVQLKLQTWDLTKTIVFTAAEQNDHFKVVNRVLRDLHPELPTNFLTHIGHGYLSLTTGKMASRTGEVLTADEVLEAIKRAVLVKMQDQDFTALEKDQAAEMIAQAAVRFTILKQGIGRDIIFDFDQALSFEGDSGPYLQYSVVRIKSVLNKAYKLDIKPALGTLALTDKDLARLITRFPDIVARATAELSPQLVVKYLLDLAKEFNQYYATTQIVNTEDAATTAHRLYLIQAVAQVLTNGLSILGIKIPERM